MIGPIKCHKKPQLANILHSGPTWSVERFMLNNSSRTVQNLCHCSFSLSETGKGRASELAKDNRRPCQQYCSSDLASPPGLAYFDTQQTDPSAVQSFNLLLVANNLLTTEHCKE